jgi:pyruvate/2-oxoglutarate dehydrogenase complex dihydrolipoamide acyltransferase (E2) component
MRTTVALPKLTETTDVLVLERWLVAPGDRVEVGQAIASIETDKVSMDFESPVAGTVAELLVGPDAEITTGDDVLIVEI